ncbi:TPA: hypothetical protein ACN306_004900 [Vibrio parahaemolyticus]|nr:hypothetical protein [Vibrio parahaemolyticus]
MQLKGSKVFGITLLITAIVMVISFGLTLLVVDRTSMVDVRLLPIFSILGMGFVLVSFGLFCSFFNWQLSDTLVWAMEFSVLMLGLTALWGVVSDGREVDADSISFYTYRSQQDAGLVLSSGKFLLRDNCSFESLKVKSYCNDLAALNENNMAEIRDFNGSELSKIIGSLRNNKELRRESESDSSASTVLRYLKYYVSSATMVSRLVEKDKPENKYKGGGLFNGWVGVGVLKVWLLINGGLALILQSVVYANTFNKARKQQVA